jgi:hypothetical protein
MAGLCVNQEKEGHTGGVGISGRCNNRASAMFTQFFRCLLCTGKSGRFNRLDFGNLLLERTLDSVFERHLGHGASGTSPLEPNLDDAVFYAYQFYITAVRLEHGPDLIDGRFHFFSHLPDPLPSLKKSLINR